jgi:hypothetical protein
VRGAKRILAERGEDIRQRGAPAAKRARTERNMIENISAGLGLREELRFAKKQQWTLTTAAVTLLVAIYALTCNEKIASAIAIVLMAGFGTWFLIKLRSHRQTTWASIGSK